jgi:hypothetical protein
MKNLKLSIVFVCMLFTFTAISQTPFRSGNVVIVRVGDGANPLDFIGAAVFLDEYTQSGNFVQTISLPTSVNGSNKMFTLSGNDPTIGYLTLSGDKRFLTMYGYNSAVGTSNFDLVTATTERTIARIDFNSVINTTTGILGSDAGGTAVSAITNDGNDFWSAGQNAGLRYNTLGVSNSTLITSNFSSIIKAINIANNQLYFSTFANTVVQVGTGLPTSGPVTTSLLPGVAVNGGGSNSQSFFVDLNPGILGPDVLYLASDGTNALQKYSFDGSTWVLNGTIGTTADDYRGITGIVNGSSVTLFCTIKGGSGGTSGGELITLTDASGYNGVFSGTPISLVSAGTNTAFRGVAMAPQPLSVSLSTKAFLAGEYNSGIARHTNVTTSRVNALNTNALNQPFNVAPFNYAGTESVSAGFFSTDDGVITDIVDWVLVELHDATTPSTIIARKACFIREDGKIVDLDKVSDPLFTGIGANNYYIVIKARNHLAIRSATTVFVNGATPVLYDFTSAQAQAYQNPAVTTNAAMRNFAGAFCMWSGNANINNNVRYTGLNNDAAALLAALGGNQASVLNPSYHPADINGDGIVRYTGLNNDAAALLSSLGGNQAAVLTEHQ